MDLIIRQAKLSDGALVDIGIKAGKIAQIAPNLALTGQQEIEAAGRLTLPAFVNGQLHACKSFWRRLLQKLPPEVQQLPRFAAAEQVKKLYTADEVFDRVDEVMRLAIQHGTCAIRLFGDVDQAASLAAIEGLLRIREKYSPWMNVQIVAFPQDGLVRQKARDLLEAALAAGADIVGGIPWIEADKAQQEAHVRFCFDLAEKYERDLHFVCDDVLDPYVRSLVDVAEQTLARDFQGRVSATQCAALAAYPENVAQRVMAKLKQADIAIFCNSHVSLIATDFVPQQPWPRGITRVRELQALGVPVACAQDDIDNWFYPFGRNDMLEVAQFMAHTGQFAWSGEVNQVLPMVTDIPAKVLGLEDYGLYQGAKANLVVLDAVDWHQAIQFQANKAYVILGGQCVVENQISRTLNLEMKGELS